MNDSLGHKAGDLLLELVAQRLRGYIRDEDTVARLGGDEFAVLLEESTDSTAAVYTAERIIAVLHEPIRLGDHEVVITGSIGIATGGAGGTGTDLLRDADVALYRAKAKGRGCYEVFDAAMNARAMERLQLEADLRLALEQGQFEVYYQPKIVLVSGQLDGMEALVRWRHPERGLVSPAAFIPLAEETALIRRLGQWVLEEVCRQCVRWNDGRSADERLVLSVNLSARQFAHPTLVAEVARALAENGTDPATLQLEITESVAMGDAEVTVTILHRLKALGVGLAIDDFGTGYSSLAYLKRFPVDVLKIDRAFVSGLVPDSDDASIIHAVLSLGRALRLSVVAEGVETAAEAAQLVALGCAVGQGYHWAKPLPRDHADRFVETRRRHAA